MSAKRQGIERRAFLKTGLCVTAGTAVAGSAAAQGANHDTKEAGAPSDIIHVTWDADIKPGQEEGFKAMAKRWAKIAAKDPGTLQSDWTISEDGKSVRMCGRYVDGAATLAQFSTNLWGDLDQYTTPTGMIVCGKPCEELEFLRAHGATFMVPIEG